MVMYVQLAGDLRNTDNIVYTRTMCWIDFEDLEQPAKVTLRAADCGLPIVTESESIG
jgi:hypothetical protein